MKPSDEFHTYFILEIPYPPSISQIFLYVVYLFSVFISDFMETDQYPTKKQTSSDMSESFDEFDEDNEDDLLISQKKHRRKKRQAPYLIFPEILCIIDYDGYRYLFFKKLSN